MLGSLRITGFRAFSDLTVERLGRVTLVVGKNNVGKTTLLEAMHVHASGSAALVAAYHVLMRREEFLADDQERDVDLERLFFRRNGTTAGGFTVSTADGGDPLLVTTMWAWSETGDDQSTRRVTGEIPPEDTEAHRIVLARREGRARDTALRLNAPSRAIEGLSRRRVLQDHQIRPSSILLPASGFQYDDSEAADLWDRIVLTEGESQVIDALRIIEPGLERIVMINSRFEERSAVAKVHGHSPMPLRSLGDGMNRLFELALGLVSVGPGGTFLIDEVDSGLHFTTLVDVWKLIFAAAASLDVQVVATTHSWDCIEAFQRAAVAHPAEGVLVRLQRVADAIRSEAFSEDDLTVITRESIEVR
jgi:hypothetical protein